MCIQLDYDQVRIRFMNSLNNRQRYQMFTTQNRRNLPGGENTPCRRTDARQSVGLVPRRDLNIPRVRKRAFCQIAFQPGIIGLQNL